MSEKGTRDDSTDCGFAWYVVQTRSRHEQVVYDQLSNQNLEVFLPMLTTWSRRTDRKQKIKIPMFPGYLFVRADLNPEIRLAIVKARGTVRIISFNGIPAKVEDEEIHSLMILMQSELMLHSWDKVTEGEKVRITHGPLKGAVGKFVRMHSSHRLVVSVEVINRSVFVNLDESFIIRCEP